MHIVIHIKAPSDLIPTILNSKKYSKTPSIMAIKYKKLLKPKTNSMIIYMINLPTDAILKPNKYLHP